MASDLPVALRGALSHNSHHRKLISVSQGIHEVQHQSTYLDAENEDACSHFPTSVGWWQYPSSLCGCKNGCPQSW